MFRAFGVKSQTARKQRFDRCRHAISEAGWTSRNKVPLGVLLKSTRPELRAVLFELDPTGSRAKQSTSRSFVRVRVHVFVFVYVFAFAFAFAFAFGFGFGFGFFTFHLPPKKSRALAPDFGVRLPRSSYRAETGDGEGNPNTRTRRGRRGALVKRGERERARHARQLHVWVVKGAESWHVHPQSPSTSRRNAASERRGADPGSAAGGGRAALEAVGVVHEHNLVTDSA